MGEWENFMGMEEKDQANFLLSLAKKALVFIKTDSEIHSKILSYINIATSIMDGKFEKIHELVIFLNDTSMNNDFNSFYEILKKNEKDAAALDIASYACGFVCRYAAKNEKITNLPDPVIESVPEIYEYYQRKAEFLKI